MEVHATEVKMCFILLVIVKQFAEFRLTSSILYGYQSKSETNVKQYLERVIQTSNFSFTRLHIARKKNLF